MRDAAKYSNIAFQMLVIIAGGIAAGVYADRYFQWKFPVFTIFASFFSVALAIYYSIKDFLK